MLIDSSKIRHLDSTLTDTDMSSKILSVSVQLALLFTASTIIYKTVSDVGIILYTFHPTLMAVGVSISLTHFMYSLSTHVWVLKFVTYILLFL
jgi:uncharacterized membrane protein